MDIRPCPPKRKICPTVTVPCPANKNCACKCVCGKGRYRQPPRPRSFAPVLCYQKPEAPLECNTIYRKSYIPATTEKAIPVVPCSNLEVPQAKFAQLTINRMSYPGWCNIRPPAPIEPCHHLTARDGPMAEITTTRHDYVPKPFMKADPVLPCPNIYTSNEPISDRTINRLSYQPVTTEKPIPIIPENSICRPEGPVSCLTVQKISYQPVPLPCKDDMPWAKKKSYEPPCHPFAKDTIYKRSYLPACAEKAMPFIPPPGENPLTCGKAFESNTIYRNSYIRNPCVEIPQPCLPSNNLAVCPDRMASDTINKMSYKPNYGFKPPEPMQACGHKLFADGPLAEITTTRHDYVPKPIFKVEPCLPTTTICGSNEPISDKTINRLSYQPNCMGDIPKPIRPTNNLGRAEGRIENCTIQKLSYQPIDPCPKEDMPWARKKTYEPPCSKMAGDTIYRMSFECPGDYVGGIDCCCTCGQEQGPLQPQNCLTPIFA